RREDLAESEELSASSRLPPRPSSPAQRPARSPAQRPACATLRFDWRGTYRGILRLQFPPCTRSGHMVDHVTPSKRSEIMRAVRSRDPGPELSLRTMLHRAGYRYRLHVKELPGTPDIVLPRLRAVIFVHGCYWHGHAGCSKAALPKSRVDFWRAKVMA